MFYFKNERHPDSSRKSELFGNHFSALILKSLHVPVHQFCLHMCAKNAYEATLLYTLITQQASYADRAVASPFLCNVMFAICN
jgi:hypothetical protein